MNQFCLDFRELGNGLTCRYVMEDRDSSCHLHLSLPFPCLQVHPWHSSYSVLITIQLCYLLISYKSLLFHLVFPVLLPINLLYFLPFPVTVLLPPCFIWNMDFPHDCMSLHLSLWETPRSPITYCKEKKTCSSGSLVSTIFSSHCSLFVSMSLFQFLALQVFYPVPTYHLVCYSLIFTKNQLPLHHLWFCFSCQVCPVFWVTSKLLFHRHGTESMLILCYISIPVEAPPLWKSCHVFCPFVNWIHELSYLFGYAFHIRRH